MSGWPDGYRLAHYPALDSTNEEARRLAETGALGPVWIIADRQTAGRGRRGRPWDGGTGNLTATLLLTRPPREAAQLSFAAALAVSDAVAQWAPRAAIAVKWPNDVLADGRKISGILLEGGQGWLAIGIGINLAGHPEGTEFPATSLTALGMTPPLPGDALALVAARFAHWYDGWMRDGFAFLRDAWLTRATGLGGPIRARLPHEERRGVFEGIDAGGALLLNEQGRVTAIAAAEVFF